MDPTESDAARTPKMLKFRTLSHARGDEPDHAVDSRAASTPRPPLSSAEQPPQNESGSGSGVPGSSGPLARFSPRTRIIAAAIVTALLLLRIALPSALEWAIPEIAARQNLHATVTNVDLGLIVGEITLENLIVDFPPTGGEDSASRGDAQTDRSQPLLSLDRLYVAFEWTDLIFRRLHITDLELDHPAIEVTQLADASLELPIVASASESGTDPIESDPTAEPIPEADSETDRGWEFMLDRFALNDPDVALRSKATQEEVVRLAADQLVFDSLFVGPDGIGLGDIDIDHPELFVERKWLLTQIQASPEAESEPPEAPPVELPSFAMKHLNIKRAAFTVRTLEGPVEVALRLELSDAGTEPGQTFPIDLGLQVGDAQIGVDGRLGLNPASFAGQLEWQNLEVPPFLLLAYPKLVPWLASCDAQGDIQIVFAVAPESGPAGLTASGSSNVSSLSFKHPETGELALEWDSLDIEIHEVFIPLEQTPELPSRFDLSRLTLDSPHIVYTNPPDALDELLAALDDGSSPEDDSDAEVAEEPEAASNASGSAPTIAISKLELTDGTLRYVDRSVNPTHETKIHKLRAKIDAITTAPAAGAKKIAVDGMIQATGSFKLRGELPSGQGELDFALRQLDLVSFDSLARSAGWEIETGTTSLDSDIVASHDGYRTKNKLVFHDLDVTPDDASDFSSRFGISVDLALALLRDPSGDIPLSVPVAITGEGAGVDVGAILLSAMRNALQGAIASPLKMLGMFVPKGASPDSLGAFPFAPGEHEPRTDERSKLESLAEFVKSRPMLSLSLHGHWSDEDRIPTALKILEESANGGGDFPEVDDASFFARRRVAAALRARAEGRGGALEPNDEALLERYVAAQEVSEARFRALADARAEWLRSSLLELGASAEALSVGTATPTEQPSVSIDLDPGGRE
jgi:hypothetical protein